MATLQEFVQGSAFRPNKDALVAVLDPFELEMPLGPHLCFDGARSIENREHTMDGVVCSHRDQVRSALSSRWIESVIPAAQGNKLGGGSAPRRVRDGRQ